MAIFLMRNCGLKLADSGVFIVVKNSRLVWKEKSCHLNVLLDFNGPLKNKSEGGLNQNNLEIS